MNDDITRHPSFDLEYTQINDNIRFLADVRFKLLGLVPALGGAGIFVLSRAGLENTNRIDGVLVVVLLVSVFGFAATPGITLYDQRNSELYNALIHRARYLERAFHVAATPGGLKVVSAGGQFRERPTKRRRLLFLAGHDLALALIYGPLLGAWLFPSIYSAMRLAAVNHSCARWAAIVCTIAAAVLFSARLLSLDRDEMERYRDAAARDLLTE